MGVLNRLFGSTEAIAREMEADDKAILQHWKDYLGTIPKKRKLIEGLGVVQNFLKDLLALKRLLELELIDISEEEKEESELISDLGKMEHSEKIRRVEKLEQCLGYASTKYEYVYGLLHHLHSSLTYEMHLVNNLLTESKKVALLGMF